MMFTCVRCLSDTRNDNDMCDHCREETSRGAEGMIDAKQIPDEAATEGMRAIYEAGENLSYPALNAAIAAALAAWPGAQRRLSNDLQGFVLRLPLMSK